MWLDPSNNAVWDFVFRLSSTLYHSDTDESAVYTLQVKYCYAQEACVERSDFAWTFVRAEFPKMPQKLSHIACYLQCSTIC
jgi:hypothetical protein